MGKWFPRFYDTFMSPLEQRGINKIRKNLLLKANGHVLEIGSGTGLNFPHYQHVEKVTAIEPEPEMRRKSEKRAKQAIVSIEVMAGSAEKLEFPDNMFDTVVGTLVLCTIPDPLKALREVRRVSKPGAIVLFFEHVRLDHPALGKLQDWMTPAWKHLCDGCHLNRNSLKNMKEAGLQIIHVERFYNDIFLAIEAKNAK